jgi:hypothetical protein
MTICVADYTSTKRYLTTSKREAAICQLMAMRNQRKTPQPGLQNFVTALQDGGARRSANTIGVKIAL